MKWKSAHREPPLDREGVRLPELVQLLNQLRQSARSKTASALLDELIGKLGLAPLASEADRQYLDRLVEFVKEWERKNEAKQLSDFIEYLGYFDELDGDVQIEEELSEDAVQLMTVHAAKGLEFPHVFILRLSKSDFPSGARRPEFEFPPALMKEEQPQGGFSHSGGAAAVLRGADARAAAADAFDDRQPAEEAFAISRRLPDEREDSENRHGAVRAESRGAAVGRNRGACAGSGRSVACFFEPAERMRGRIRAWRCGRRRFIRRVPSRCN